MLEAKHLLVTGGAGSFGRAFVEHVLDAPHGPSLVTVFSRDEHKHHELAKALTRHADRLRFVVGDMRDLVRLEEVLSGVDLVVHAAAMKHVPAAEDNPFECVQTNIGGARNLALAAKRSGVAKVVALSTDKAVSPSTVYGASKLTMERLLIQSDAQGPTRFSLVRYANVFGSGGSVVPLFLSLRASGVLPITDPDMTRFSITMSEGINLVLFAMNQGLGGEIVVPIAPSYRVGDVAEAIAPKAEHKIIGARPGEKVHEAMFSMAEAPFVARREHYYIVAPRIGRWRLDDYCAEVADAQPLETEFEYGSGSNTDWLSVQDIRTLVRSEFSVEC